jgi:pilus assembly protein CpaB
VIAVGDRDTGQTTSGPSTGGSGASDETTAASGKKNEVSITVAVTQAQAEKLVHATQTGALYLGLLGTDSKVKPGAGVDNNSLFQ